MFFESHERRKPTEKPNQSGKQRMDMLHILAIATLIAATLSGRIYEMTGMTSSGQFVTNRFTGSVWSCSEACVAVRDLD